MLGVVMLWVMAVLCVHLFVEACVQLSLADVLLALVAFVLFCSIYVLRKISNLLIFYRLSAEVPFIVIIRFSIGLVLFDSS